MKNTRQLIRRGAARCARFSILILCAIIAACTPAATPEHLLFTPGPAVVITNNIYTADGFTVRYPEGWRIVTGSAEAPQTVTFVSPDNCAIILVTIGSAAPITSQDCPDTDFQTVQHEIALDTFTLTIAGSAPVQQWEAFTQIFEALTVSIQAA